MLIWLRDLACLLLVGVGMLLLGMSGICVAISLAALSWRLGGLGIAGLLLGRGLVKIGERWL